MCCLCQAPPTKLFGVKDFLQFGGCWKWAWPALFRRNDLTDCVPALRRSGSSISWCCYHDTAPGSGFIAHKKLYSLDVWRDINLDPRQLRGYPVGWKLRGGPPFYIANTLYIRTTLWCLRKFDGYPRIFDHARFTSFIASWKVAIFLFPIIDRHRAVLTVWLVKRAWSKMLVLPVYKSPIWFPVVGRRRTVMAV